jgi:hypothetical protein
MEAHLMELKDKYFEAKGQFETESAFVEDLKKRISSTAIRLNLMIREFEEMTEVRNVLLKQISRNEATEEDLKKQTIKIDDFKLSQRNVEDLLTTLRQTLKETESKVIRLSEAFLGQRHALWFAVSEYEASKLKEVEGPLIRSWSAFLLAGCPPNLGPFLQSRFANFKWDISQVEAELKKEYLETKPSKKGGDQ